MTLRRKILLSFTMLSLINGLICLFILEAAWLRGPDFDPATGSIIAPGLPEVGLWLLVGTAVVAWLLFATMRRLVLDPLQEISRAADLLGSGETKVRIPCARSDELGHLAATFNTMAQNVLDSRLNLEDKVRVAAEQIERTQKDLAFSERLAATGRLAAGVAHEINNPLAGVMNAAARLRRPDLTPERTTKYLDICDEGLRRIQQIVRRILDFSRKRPDPGPVRPAAALQLALDLVRHRLEQDHTELRMELEAPDAQVVADTGDLQQVFLNLLVNALDAMPNGGAITLRQTAGDGVVVTEVADTGVGMTEEETTAAFEYFHTSKPAGKGTGLGLSIAHHIIQGYNGTLELHSTKGQGTRATVTLPQAPGADNANTLV